MRSSKLGSIGLAVRRGITLHGFALNVCNSMEHFQWINPCGLQGIRMTSLQVHVEGRVSVEAVRAAAKEEVERVFGVRLTPWTLKALQSSLDELPHREVEDGSHGESPRKKAPLVEAQDPGRGDLSGGP